MKLQDETVLICEVYAFLLITLFDFHVVAKLLYKFILSKLKQEFKSTFPHTFPVDIFAEHILQLQQCFFGLYTRGK